MKNKSPFDAPETTSPSIASVARRGVLKAGGGLAAATLGASLLPRRGRAQGTPELPYTANTELSGEIEF